MTAKLILTDIAFLPNLHKMLKTFMSKFILPTPDFPWYTSIFVHMCLFTSVFYLECFSKSINKSKFHIFFLYLKTILFFLSLHTYYKLSSVNYLPIYFTTTGFWHPGARSSYSKKSSLYGARHCYKQQFQHLLTIHSS